MRGQASGSVARQRETVRRDKAMRYDEARRVAYTRDKVTREPES